MSNKEWAPIDDAPKDATPVLGWSKIDGMVIVQWQDYGMYDGAWYIYDSNCDYDNFATPTHFMRLPDPPSKGDRQ